MNNERLEQLEALANKATEGPWKVTEVMGHSHVRNAEGKTVVGFTTIGHNCAKTCEARLIAASRTAIPELIAEVRRLREVLEFYADQNRYLGHDPEMWWGDRGQRARDALKGE